MKLVDSWKLDMLKRDVDSAFDSIETHEDDLSEGQREELAKYVMERASELV